MDESRDTNKPPQDKKRPPEREIRNANLFAGDIEFSDTEKILFEEDLQEKPTQSQDGLMDGKPASRYTPKRKLNQGGMKAIWEVDDHRTARRVAMALIEDSRIASQDDIDAFLYEARLTANLQHPSIVPIYDIALDENGNPFFTMKALRGDTLDHIIQMLGEGDNETQQRYTPTRLLDIFLEVCNAIAYAHSKGVIHLDLKPSNVMIGDYGDVQVLDWGLSTLVTHLGDCDGQNISQHGNAEVSLETGEALARYLETTTKRRHVVGGTPGYMSPEQAQGMLHDITFQTDVYMLGAMLYEILTQSRPIKADTVKEILQKTVRGDIPSPAKRSPEHHIPNALAAIAMKAIQTDPKERYPNVPSLINDIHKYQDGYATSAENPTFLTHAALLVRRHKVAVGLIAVALAIISGILAKSFTSIKRSERLAREALSQLQVKNDYIAATARKVAPDYINLMERAEREFEFAEAADALNTSLAFDPMSETGRWKKGRILLCQRDFSSAWDILSGTHGSPVRRDDGALTLAEKYKDAGPITDTTIPPLVADFVALGMRDGIPRLFYHLNRMSFSAENRFLAIEESLKLLNPNVENLNFSWNGSDAEGWEIDIGNNPGLDDISPLCGLAITTLIANNTGNPNLKLITERGMRKMDLSGSQLGRLFDIDQFADLESLDIGRTRIRNLDGILKYPKITTLDISHIEGLSISPQLIWCQNIKLLTVDAAFRDEPTIRALARRGTIIIYTD